MSRLEQGQGDLVRNPAKRFLEFKNVFNKEEVIIKGKPKEIKVFEKAAFTYAEKEGEEWINHIVDLPLEFALLNGDWVNFKGWSETDKCKYYSNEVKNADEVISIRNKEGIVYEFTLNQMWGKVAGSKVKDEAKSKEVKAALKGLGVKQHSSLYVAMKNEDSGEFEMINIQIKGANLSGVKDSETPSGWWNFSKKFKPGNVIYKKYIQLNDWVVEDGELGEYGVLNWSFGSLISEEEEEQIEVLFKELESYHIYYLDRSKEVVKAVPEVPALTTKDDDDESQILDKLPF